MPELTPGSRGETWGALGDSARRFIESSYPDERRRGVTATAPGFDRKAWRAMAELGWLGLALPEDYGGLGSSVADLVPVAEAMGAGNLPEPVIAVAGVAAPLLAGLGPRAGALLSRIISGESIVALAHSEPRSGYARDHVETRAARDGAAYVVSGAKTAVPGGAAADLLIVTACVGETELGAFLVPSDAPGVTVSSYRTIDGRWLADVGLAEVRIEGGARIGGDAAAAVDAALDRGALLTMADAVGAMDVLLSDTLAYLRTRHQFGRPLASFQVLQHRAVDMFLALEEARAVVEGAADALDRDSDEARLAIATAKIVGVRSARRIGREAIQLHGGVGMSDELRVGHLFKRLVAAEGSYGDASWYLRRFRTLSAARA